MQVKGMRTTIMPPRGLSSKNKKIFTDPAGNCLFAKRKSNGIVQYSGKNREGAPANHEGVKTLMRRWNKQR